MAWQNFNSDEQQELRAIPSSIPPSGCFCIDQESYTSGQAARLLDIPARTLRRYLSIGKIKGSQNPITQTWQISRESLAKFVEKQGGRAVINQNEISILIIDCNPMVCDFLNQANNQSRPGLSIQTFKEVGDALIESGVSNPDLIIIDITNPIYDGVQLLSTLHNNQHTKSSKVLAIAETDERKNELQNSGATMILVKPFSYNDLLETIDMMFPKKTEIFS